MNQKYKYDFLFHSVPLKEIPDLITEKGDPASSLIKPIVELAKFLNQEVPKLPPGDWELISHDTVQFKNVLFITILVRRKLF